MNLERSVTTQPPPQKPAFFATVNEKPSTVCAGNLLAERVAKERCAGRDINGS
jgi:hypothetical protein